MTIYQVIKGSLLILALIMIAGCQILPSLRANDSLLNVDTLSIDGCVFEKGSFTDKLTREQCSLAYWIQYWTSASEMKWSERRALITNLSESRVAQLERFLLSQPIDTPYQDRLRAQSLFKRLSLQLHPAFVTILDSIAVEPSQKLLEYESAITLMSEVNSRQAQRVKEQASLLEEQERTINQLLSIEASIIEKARSDN